MIYSFKNQKVKLDLDRKSKDLLILSEDGAEIIAELKRANVESMSADVITISGFREKNNGSFRYEEMKFIYSI